jgi:heat-inducible transcriptional repressor
LELSERKKKILAAVVDEYIATAEPVGSKLIAQKSGLEVSSATIRNELSELTSMGYLQQPHTSAGRVPTPQGYRIYVNELMEQHKLSMEETEKINRSLNTKMQQLDQVISDVGKLAAELTDYPALALSAKAPATVKRFDLIYVDSNTFIIVAMLSSNAVKNKLIHLPFSVEQSMVQKLSTVFNASFTGITEDEISPVLISSTERSTGDTMGLVAVIAGFAIEILSEEKAARAVLSGEAKLLQLPEFRDPDKAHKVMNYLSDAEHLYDLPGMDFGDDIKVLIGPENIAEELKDSSVILAKYNAGDGMQGVIGVVGPTRMDYSTVAAKLSYIAGGLSKMLGSSGADKTLPGFGKLMIKDSNQ